MYFQFKTIILNANFIRYTVVIFKSKVLNTKIEMLSCLMKFSKIFLLKLLYINQVSNLMHFQEEMIYLFFLQNKALRSESVNQYISVALRQYIHI